MISPIAETFHTLLKLTRVFLLALTSSFSGMLWADAGNNEQTLKIFILAGQSNMEGTGTVKGPVGTMEAYAKSNPSKYAHLLDASGEAIPRNDVWVVDISHKPRQGFLTTGFAKQADLIGPEYAFGHILGDYFSEPVLIVKSAWGGKSLYNDFLPPSAQDYPKPQQAGDTGFYYQEILRHVSEITQNLDKYCPRFTGSKFEIAGFGWHQGWNDRIKPAAVDAYESNLAHLIRDLRKDLAIDKLPFVIANTGIGGWELEKRYKARVEKHVEGQLAVGNGEKYPEFAGNVAGVETRDFWKDPTLTPSPNGRQGFHWNRDWETFYQIGEGMGLAMIKLLEHPSKETLGMGQFPEPKLEALFMAQTHVSRPEDPYFFLTSNRPALIKAHVTAPGTLRAPEIKAHVHLQDRSLTLPLKGPAYLPNANSPEPGIVQHSFSDSYTATIPAEWVMPGMAVMISVGNKTKEYSINTRAPNPLKLTTFDIHFFGKEGKDYAPGFFDELEAKWPTSKLEVQKVTGIKFQEMVIPCRLDVKTPHVKVSSEADYKAKTGQRFDGEQAAALQWVRALVAAGGHYDIALTYVNITGVHSGGQATNFFGVGQRGAHGVAHHELGHAFGLPHWWDDPKYPYRGDMLGYLAPSSITHVGPTWAYDLPSMTFISPIIQKEIHYKSGTIVPNRYFRKDPMQGGGTGHQDAPFLLGHFSDYSSFRMNQYIENKLAVRFGNDYFKWDSESGKYAHQVSNDQNRGISYPIEENVEVYSVMAACILADKDTSMIYPPIGPYMSNLMLNFDPRSKDDRALAIQKGFVPSEGCDYTLVIEQGGTSYFYMLPASGSESQSIMHPNSLTTRAINVPTSKGQISRVELWHTPDAQINGIPEHPEILSTWTDGSQIKPQHYTPNDI